MGKKDVYVWDSDKEASNDNKHGISFDMAVLALEDPGVLIEQDHVTEDGECRLVATGMVEGTWLLVVVHTVHEEEDGTEVVRIISARCANSKEERRYEQNSPI